MTVSQCLSCESWTYYKKYLNDDDNDFRGKKIWYCSNASLGSRSKAKKHECPGYFSDQKQLTLTETIK